MLKDTIAVSQEEQFEGLIDGLLQQQYAYSDNFIDEAIVEGLRNNLLERYYQGKMHPARVGYRFEQHQNATIRGDEIKWMEKDTTDPFERAYLDKVQHFIEHLNSTCFTAINDFEFHYAFYAQRSFYKRHLDQFKKDKGRKFSLVLYLNDNWQEEDGGQLSLYLDTEKQAQIYPHGGRLVFFKSDEIEHEVHPSFNRFRLSIAGWLKS